MRHKKRKPLPCAYISSRELADLLKFKTTQGAIEFMKREGLGRKLGGRWRVSMAQLQANYPEMAASAVQSA
jgi:hypothetical protein